MEGFYQNDMKKIKRILIANRGEIACRVIRTARKMGIETVAVYSDVDRDAPHVVYADKAIHIGPAPASQSYLVVEKIISAAKESGADAIHPGYGFLSERSVFAKACKDAGIIFIGPGEEAIDIMGNKIAAKTAVSKYDIPLVPGTAEPLTDKSAAASIAKEIGFPVLIKAAAGGGGKGMRIVYKEKEILDQVDRAVSEAKSAFGDGAVFIEKYVTSPRHIEVQILADQHGHIIHLNERECSIQRRHQKVVEEAPSPMMTPELREKIGQDAINVARSCNYVGAGTVEFIMNHDNNYYFLEMNTRLQVEHPITEAITGVDLVEQQIRIAQGEHLSIQQEDVKCEGHAVELRIYAEDPRQGFVPSIGHLEVYQPPSHPDVRVDDGYREGMDVPIYYDPMLSKLITYSDSRQSAISAMKKAIQEYRVVGVETTLSFGTYVCDHPVFLSGTYDTHFVENHYNAEDDDKVLSGKEALLAKMALQAFLDKKQVLSTPLQGPSQWSR